jgi:DNA-binding GntR family transcriptional regulator
MASEPIARAGRKPRAPRLPRAGMSEISLTRRTGPATARPSSGDLVADHIRRLIFEGRLQQGDHLRQDEIAAELGVSRIPVREAVIALDREGWLTIEPHRGAFVHALDEGAVRDHYEVIGLLYGMTARRATERGDDAALTELVARHRELRQIDEADPDAFWMANNAYLRQLFHMADSARLAALSRLMRNLVPGNFFAEVPTALADQRRGLAAVTKAVRARDGAQAEVECRRLMDRQGDAVVALMTAHGLIGREGR